MTPLNIRAIRQSILGAFVMAALLFVPAGTFGYWQGWVFMAVFAGCSTAITVYLAIYAPSLLERRMRVGPAAETERTQKIAVSFAFVGFFALLVIPAFDRRFGWSQVPVSVSLLGDALIVLSFVEFWLVTRENEFAAGTIQIASDQHVISTGPYAIVRHPMYSGALVLAVAVPLALGSWWGLLGIGLLFPGVVWRLLDEERFLKRKLSGYPQYTERVRYRLVPLVW